MIYSLAIYIYMLCARCVALFKHKVSLMVRGQKNTYRLLSEKLEDGKDYIWFHAASLGEFEQGRPLMERVTAKYPQYKILLTFFSPSGYEVMKNYVGADIVCYLPFDTPGNARRFVSMVNPKMVFFIKYEFWMNYLKAVHRRRIPLYSVSSIFRKEQIFFRSYGSSYIKALRCFSRFFVQNEESKALLSGIGIKNVSVTGDTRFDRVIDIRREAKDLPIMENFDREGSRVLVAGSSWSPDEDILIPYFNAHKEVKLILAPHVVSEDHLHEIETKLSRPFVRFTQCTPERIAAADCLIMDCYGLLSSVYRYGDVVYVGGGFGVGIHNVPEAAVYGVPVVIGPNNKRFQEAQALLSNGGCVEICDAESFATVMDRFLSDDASVAKAGKAASDYIKSNSGASDEIFDYCFK